MVGVRRRPGRTDPVPGVARVAVSGAAVLALVGALVVMPSPGAGAAPAPIVAPASGTTRVGGAAVPTPTAPSPTSTAVSPDAPDPAPPAGGAGPGGRVPGGSRLLAQDLVVPAGAAPLPAGVTAQAWVMVDLGDGAVLAARDAHGRYQPASILKTLTALVLLPRLRGSQTVPVSAAAADAEGSAVGLAPGGAYSADVLFTAMLLMSGNDATEALSEAAGGDTAVVAGMNRLARDLGAYDTVVQTPTGLDGWSQLTSAYDMALVLRAAVADPRLVAYDEVARADLPAQTVLKNGQPVGPIEMDNQSSAFLDGYDGALLAKTGFTDAARHTFLCAARRDGRTLGVVMLRAERAPTDQWQQAATLLDWGFARPAGAPVVGTLDGSDVPVRAATPAPGTTATGTAAAHGAAASGLARAAGPGTARAAAAPVPAHGIALGPLAALAGVAAVAAAGAAALGARRRRGTG